MADQKSRLSPLSLMGDGLLLLCAVMGLTASFLTLYTNHGLGSTPLDPCVGRLDSFLLLAALFALLSLTAWSLPRFRALAAAVLAALWAGTVMFFWKRAVCGAILTAKAVADQFALRVSWGRTFFYDSGLLQREEHAAVALFLTLSLALLALGLGWAVVRARRWWVVLLLTLPLLFPGLLADLYPSWPAFMALTACWCTLLLTDLCKWAAPDRRDKLTLAALAGTAAVLAVLSLSMPREGYTRPDWALRAENRLIDTANRLSDFFSRWNGPFQSAATYVGGVEEADLTGAGPLNYTGRTVLRVTADYSGRLYLRGTSLAVYDDGVWRALPEGTYQRYLDRVNDPEDTISPLLLPARFYQQSSRTVTVDNVGAVGSCVYTPYFLTGQDWEEQGMLPVEDAYFAHLQGRWSQTMGFVPPEVRGLYSGGNLQVSGYYQDYVYDNYLDVPQELETTLAPMLRELREGRFPLRVTTGTIYTSVSAESCIWVAQQVARILEERCEYDLTVSAPPEGEDPVAWFLNESRRGYCMHFASAATLLLRSMGIPARYVNGFTADCRPGQRVNVPDRAAHAWVEIWLDNFGWYPVEVTPAAAFSGAQTGEPDPTPTPSASEPPQESETPKPTPTPEATSAPEATARPSDAPQPGGGPDLTALLPLIRGAAIAVGAVLALWLGQYLPKKHRARRMAGPDPNRAALDGYHYLLRLERWGGRVDPQALELAEKARFSQHTLTPEELAAMGAFVDRERARLCAGLGPLKRLVFRYWWGKPRQVPPEGAQ